LLAMLFFFFQAEDGIRDATVTGVQTCALPISLERPSTGYDLFDAVSLAHCQNFSAAGLSRPVVPAMPTEIGFGSGVTGKNFRRRSEERRVGKEWRSRGAPEA